jgi:hypothetical protein
VLGLLDELTAAFTARDWARLRRLYHPQARLATIASSGAYLNREQTIEVLQQASATPGYAAAISAAQPLDQHAALLAARLRQPDTTSTIPQTTRIWLHTTRDGLLYRTAVYPNPLQAQNAYREHGATLGIPD